MLFKLKKVLNRKPKLTPSERVVFTQETDKDTWCIIRTQVISFYRYYTTHRCPTSVWDFGSLSWHPDRANEQCNECNKPVPKEIVALLKLMTADER